MVDNEVKEQSKRKQVRQPPSVPFLWEVKPGIPKKDWKPEKTSSVNPTPVPSTPVKLFASIPFKWEEMPGKPLPSLLQRPADPPPLLLPPANLIDFSSPWPQSHDYNYDSDDVGVDADGSNSDDEQDDMFEMDPESFGFETDESFSSTPTLLANRLQSSVAISNAVSFQKTPVANYKKSQPESLSSPPSETDSSTSSYAMGTTSLVGSSFLDCLFPLLPPYSGFLEKVGNSEKRSLTPPEQQNKDLDCESNCSVVVRRPPTLGELIMMSRRRSHRRKAVQMRKQNLSMKFSKKTAFGCCSFGISSNGIGRLHGKMMQPRLKLM